MQYDLTVKGSEVYENLDNNEGISDETRDAMASHLGLGDDEDTAVFLYDGKNYVGPSGEDADLVIFSPGGPGPHEISVPPELLGSARGYVFETDDDVTIHFNTVERVIAMGNGNDLVTVDGDKNTTLDGSDGNDTLITSGGDDSVTGGAGDDSVSTGDGNDTIVAGNGADTVDGGAGYDVVKLQGTIDAYEISVVDGQLVLVSTADAANSLTVDNVEFIQFTEGSLAVVGNETDAVTLRLYQGLLDRPADQAGAQYWLEQVNKAGATVWDQANAFLNTEEFLGHGELSHADFVELLYDNALGRAADEEGLNYWVNDLENGQSRAQVAVNIIGSAEAAEQIDSVQILDGLV